MGKAPQLGDRVVDVWIVVMTDRRQDSDRRAVLGDGEPISWLDLPEQRHEVSLGLIGSYFHPTSLTLSWPVLLPLGSVEPRGLEPNRLRRVAGVQRTLGSGGR